MDGSSAQEPLRQGCRRVLLERAADTLLRPILDIVNTSQGRQKFDDSIWRWLFIQGRCPDLQSLWVYKGTSRRQYTFQKLRARTFSHVDSHRIQFGQKRPIICQERCLGTTYEISSHLVAHVILEHRTDRKAGRHLLHGYFRAEGVA